MITVKRLSVLASVPLLTACAATGDYPSLAQRPAERIEGSFIPDAVEAAPAPPIAPAADLVQQLAGLRQAAEAAHAEFRAATPAAQRLAGAAGATGSDSWASAQVALADLDSLRSRTAIALADLDALWVEANVEPGPREAIGAVRVPVEALVADEDAVLARLRARL